MTQLKPDQQVCATFGKYRLIYNPKSHPVGLVKGAVVTADLAAGLPEFNVKQYFATQPTIFCDYDHVVTAYANDSGAAIGLLGARWLGTSDLRFLYLWTAMIADSYRRSLLFNRMLAFFFASLCGPSGARRLPELIVTKTYNPVVYNIFKSFSLSAPGIAVYPEIPATQQSPLMVDLAQRIAHAISPQLILHPEDGTVIGGQAMVAPDFFPRMEDSNNTRVNQHFQKHLSRADQILCILRIPPEVKHEALRLATMGRSTGDDRLTNRHLSSQSADTGSVHIASPNARSAAIFASASSKVDEAVDEAEAAANFCQDDQVCIQIEP